MTTKTKTRRMKCSCLQCRTQWKARLWNLNDKRDILVSDQGTDEIWFGVKWANCPNPDCRAAKIVSFSYS